MRMLSRGEKPVRNWVNGGLVNTLARLSRFTGRNGTAGGYEIWNPEHSQESNYWELTKENTTSVFTDSLSKSSQDVNSRSLLKERNWEYLFSVETTATEEGSCGPGREPPCR